MKNIIFITFIFPAFLFAQKGSGTIGSGNTGTVTSIGLTAPSFLSVSGSPVTGNGTIGFTLVPQTANTIFAGPTSGAAAAPTLRAMVADDLPTVTVAKGGTGLTVLGTADQQLRVNAGATALEYFTPTTVTASTFTATVTQSGSDTLQNSATAYGHFHRIGNVVTFTVRIEIAMTNTGNANTVYFSPPIASNFTTASTDVIGTATLDAQGLSSANIPRQRALLFASDSDDKIGISFDPVASLTYPENRQYISVSGSYIIK